MKTIQKGFIVLCAIIFCFIASSQVMAIPTIVNAEWLPNNESDLAGYRFYLVNRVNALDIYSVGQVDCSYEMGLSSTTLQFNVPSGAVYILMMTAFDQADNESTRSKAATTRNTRRIYYFHNKGGPKTPLIRPMDVLVDETN